MVALKPATSAIITPRASQKIKTPRNIAKPSIKHCLRFCATWDRLIILIGIKGKTQGVKFSSIPPKAAVTSSKINPYPVEVFIEKVQPNRSKFTPPEVAKVEDTS